jgi:heme-degrading monooxygenase HmoA
MFAVIFEVQPRKDQFDDYLNLARLLKPELEQIDGFISIERFQSLTDESKLVSLSFFRDEAAVKAWRNVEHHRQAQAAGRGGVLRDYRLRIASVVRDYGMEERAEAPADSREKNG